MNRKLLFTLIALILTVLIPMSAFGASASKSPLTYTVTVHPSGDGQLYWDYGENLEFFLITDAENYNGKCLIKASHNYKFSTLLSRSIIAKPGEDSYLSGFYSKTGQKLSLSAVKMDVLRIKKDGIYFYDYYPSYENNIYQNFTKERYKEEVKNYLKAIYGTGQYKQMGFLMRYSLPKKSMDIYPKFKKKIKPEIDCKSQVSKTFGDGDFYLCGKDKLTPELNAVFKSSNSKVLTTGKTDGLASIKGEGIATVTIKIPEGEKTLPAEFKVKISVKPKESPLISTKKKDDKTLAVKWKADSKATGYQIQVAPDKTFSNITAKKTVTSAKTTSTTLTLKKDGVYKYVRIRPYKQSCGEKLYGNYDVMKIQ